MANLGFSRGRAAGWLLLAVVPVAAFGQGGTFTKYAVSAQESHAADVGRDALRAGGNAIDAAVATAFAMAVTLPEAGNLGGGGFIVAYLPASKRVVDLDFRETAPGSSTPRMYLDAEGNLLPRHRAGAWAAGVPGTVRGLGTAHAKWGKLPWRDLVAPAVKLAREGFPISDELAVALNVQLRPRGGDEGRGRVGDRMADFPESVAAFGKPDGQPWKGGDLLVQGDLASTLERIAAEGPDEFYTGRTADLIAAYMTENDGRISRKDLADYRAKERPPVRTTYRGHDVYSVGPASSGGVVLCQMLNILERYDLMADGPQSPRTLHRVTEAMRRAYYTRATRLGDPDFVDVPFADLASKAAADELARSIDDSRATPSAELAPFPIVSTEPDHTTHFSVIDGEGGAVAMTYTLEDSYGAKAVVKGAGFLLNNEMGDFNLRPGRTDDAGAIGTYPNQIAPGKRMLSSQCPTLVLKDGKVRMVTGSPGGRTIPNTTLWVVLNVLEFGLEPQAAVDAPRTHHSWFPDVVALEGREWPQETLKALTDMGHKLRTGGRQGNANSIVVDPADGRIFGAPDRRRTTTKASGD
ncbi:gamma-glutamyltransferase [Planctomyces sp. SH-PL62]|uniref:gamma-glutamyltransferase n=1 Tax=Planctomyces sp. SH-PL62 TaxID=1636152 RepID=UPI00078CCC1D|nr:gamma-glutamyltransferase [Planctomyces sp. SH-PL62]AMV38728.1 Gamma-glutamyltranspeptidase precursor [Planctomyces sp. SH-PL62]